LDKIRVLQLGAEDWSRIYALPDGIVWKHEEELAENPEKTGKQGKPEKPFDIVFWARAPRAEERGTLYKCTRTHTLFVPESVELDEENHTLYVRLMGKRIADRAIGDFLKRDLLFFFPHSYGEKFQLKSVEIVHDFSGRVAWNGNCEITLCDDFGEEMRQIAFWRNDIPIMKQQTLDFWLEYSKSGSVEIALVVTQLQGGSISNVQRVWRFDERELAHVVQVTNEFEQGYLFLHLEARGSGMLKIRALHDRHSRGPYGYFLPGGERIVTSQREEVFGYFDPGDFRPPLCVYFSGYKTRQGFEGAGLMKSFGCPFLLISEARLEGGSFYMGTQEYEQAVTSLIRKYLNWLHFTPRQLILSGISMGSIGALYHGCELTPHAIIVGKPLVNCGTIAVNERLRRPGGFATSLDVLQKLGGKTDAQAVEDLNRKFWDRFDRTSWSDTRIIAAYMIEDDYDDQAYPDLLEHLDSSGVQIYGKGLHGRHNDNSGGIVSWFSSQYKKILHEEFARSVKN
jgi:accessory secretory protein Asp2